MTEPRPGRWRRRRIIAVVVAVVVLAAAVDAFMLWNRVERQSLHLVGSPAGGTTVLLVGSDSRAFVQTEADRRRFGPAEETPGERADVVLALRIDDHGQVRLLELSRDLLVLGPDNTPVRLTTTLLDGPQGVADSLCRSLGLGVDHLVEIRFPGLRSIIDSIGGVEVTVDRPLRDLYTRIHLSRGRNVLDGNAALEYVGARHVELRTDDGRWVSDDGSTGNRSARAAQVMRQIGGRLSLSPFHPFDTQDRLWALAGAVVADDSLGIGDLWTLQGALRRLPSIRGERLPLTTTTGQVPVDQLRSGAGATLRRFEGTRSPSPHCRARLPQAADGR